MNDTYMGHDKTDTQLEADLPLELPEKEPRRGHVVTFAITLYQ